MDDYLLDHYANIYIEHNLQATGLTFHEFLAFITRLESTSLLKIEQENKNDWNQNWRNRRHVYYIWCA